MSESDLICAWQLQVKTRQLKPALRQGKIMVSVQKEPVVACSFPIHVQIATVTDIAAFISAHLFSHFNIQKISKTVPMSHSTQIHLVSPLPSTTADHHYHINQIYTQLIAQTLFQ